VWSQAWRAVTRKGVSHLRPAVLDAAIRVTGRAAKPDTTTVTLVVEKYWRERESHRHRMHSPFVT